MKFTQDNATTPNAVTGRSIGEVRIGELWFRRSVVVSATSIIEDWAVGSIDDIGTALDVVLGLEPDILILGTGESQVFPDPAVHATVAARGIGFEVMDNGAACRTYNVLLAEGRNVALALIL